MSLLNINRRVLLSALVLTLLGASISAKPLLTTLQADLLPITNNFKDNGVIFVVNQGAQASKSTWLTLDCSGACPAHPSMNTYSHPLFPERMAVEIPALKAGQVFKHQLQFWNQVSFGKNKAKITFFVDAESRVAEIDESNNRKIVVID